MHYTGSELRLHRAKHRTHQNGMGCRRNHCEFVITKLTNTPPPLFSPKRKLTGRHKREPTDEDVGLCLMPSAPAVGLAFGVRLCGWGLCRRGTKTHSPQGATKKKISHLSAQGARPRMTPGAFGTRAGKARLRDTAASAKLLSKTKKSKNLPNNGIIVNLTFRITPKLKMTFGPVWLAHTGLFYWLESSEELARLSLSTSA